jgi:signal transduction histidine kinase/CheY-like chemotaxis protein
MKALGKIRLQHRSSVHEARDKIRGLAIALGFDAMETTRLATAVSELARELYCRNDESSISVALNLSPPQLVLDFECHGQPPERSRLTGFFDSLVETSIGGVLQGLRAMKWLPSGNPALTDTFLAAQRRRIQRLSREELIGEIEQKNRDLERHSEQLEETVAQRTEQLEQAIVEADAANKAKGDFLANMSHEIRTPMNAILGMTHLALKTELSAKQSDYLHKVQSSATSLLGIINDILDFSKIEAGKLDMEAVEFSLDEALAHVAALISDKAQEKSLEFLFQVPPDLPRFLVGDPLRLGQILINLANNAVKFTEAGEVVVSVERVVESGQEVTLKFTVRDTGIGLTEEQAGKLFQSFSQADTSTTRKYGGTGLGLTISKKLTEMMGGNIWLESRLGEGSRFMFTADFGKAEPPEETGPLMVAEALRHKRVLVVDDNETSRLIFKQMLESFSFEVVLCSSGREGVKAAAQASPPFELVVMDWQMPGMNGFKAIEAIRALGHLKEQPRFVLATAFAREDVIRQAEEAQLDGLMIKPVSPSAMFDAIMGAFGKDGLVSVRRNTGDDYDMEALKPVQGAKILLAEDNEINQQIARELLEGAGFIVDIANNGAQAVKMVSSGEYEIVLMDVQMPEMDGHEATARIRENLSQEELPVVAMTAGAMAEDKEAALECGMNDHVSKPIDIKQLFDALLHWIKPGQREVPEPRKAAGDDESDTMLPRDLPGINVQLGLQRVGGNPVLYRDLLRKFRSAQSGVADDMRAALQGSDPDLAVRLTHNLAGVSGNLGATGLAQAARDLEAGIKNNGLKFDPVLLALTQGHLDQVISSLSVLDKDIQSRMPVEPISQEQLAHSLEQLQVLAENSDANATKLIKQLVDQLTDVTLAESLAAIEQALDCYDFELALDHLAKLQISSILA